MIRIRFIDGSAPWVVEIFGPSASIGRRPPVDVVIHDMNVARHHCDLREEGGRLRLFDAKSTGGTPVGRARVPAGYVLSAEDVVGFPGWQFRAELVPSGTVDGRAPAPSPDPTDSALAALTDGASLHAAIRRRPELVRLLVSRLDTPAGVLEELARCPAREVQRAVARHPNSPPSLLSRLAAHYRDDVEQNPSLPLLLLEDPSLARVLGRPGG